MEFSDRHIELMRYDLENNFATSKFVDAAKRILKLQGRNFDEEFKRWKERLIEKNKPQEEGE